ncbi:MAG TPA: electron transfer flavoprotein subunit beta/FixA family protein [bacterium]|nr:electron transfer flavoprotein subunit beta/FixA family protein [Candidatus Omnitrophota bacterium]HOJ61635.1 electron transfer flavoprotein subunit beta/FixA family protein [bacterium]HOL93464.1 electron transfer flavoprotein subunit beta/FixA family protein [bacterium]HXK93943.1 electron transfer flavoprotein subunit beta/FixA family protein [bacterium]
MKISVVIRQVPDLIEPLTINSTGTWIDYEEAMFLVNEYDDHALEQALLLKEAHGGAVTAVALDFGDVEETLYAAAAKGVDRIIKIPYTGEKSPSPLEAAPLFAPVIASTSPDLVLVGVQSYEELQGTFAPYLAHALKLPYAGLIQGVEAAGEGFVRAYKEFPGAAKALLRVQLPAVLGILSASKPPRYVPISRVRAAMKEAHFEEQEGPLGEPAPGIHVKRLFYPEVSGRAEILEGSEEDIAAKIIQIFEEKGVIS